MLYAQDITRCFAGTPVTKKSFDKNLERVSAAKTSIRAYQNGRAQAILDSARHQDFKLLENIAEKIRKHSKGLVVFGTGGSTLNPQSIVALRQDLNPDFKIYFADAIDPVFMDSLFAELDLANTAFLTISKSGGTIETISQMLFCLQKLQQASVAVCADSFVIITDPKPSVIRTIGEEIGATILDHEEVIGGRFATFTNVALLPALVSGLNGKAFCQGGAEVVEQFFATKYSFPEEGAALALSAMDAGLNMNVFMPYVKRLQPFTAWLSQIWAESLGKEGKGSTPVQALGTLDQHSQLQLYLDGPQDKLFNVIGVRTPDLTAVIHSSYTASQKLEHLEGKTFAQINNASQDGTVAALAGRGRPVRVITLERWDEQSLGILMMHFIFETILTAQVLNINAFDQPAVEDGKQRTRTLLCGEE